MHYCLYRECNKMIETRTFLCRLIWLFLLPPPLASTSMDRLGLRVLVHIGIEEE
jgi:hypothetical protein